MQRIFDKIKKKKVLHMTTQFWRNLGYLLCLVGLWFRIAAAEYGDELRLIVAFVAFWGGVVLLALLLFFEWADQSGHK